LAVEIDMLEFVEFSEDKAVEERGKTALSVLNGFC